MRFFIFTLTLSLILSCASNYKDIRPQSRYFKQSRFHNEHPPNQEKGLWDVIFMRFGNEWATWPDHIPIRQNSTIKSRISNSRIHITLINHATALIQTQGLNILTDPIYSKRCSPVSFIGPKRVHEPGIKFDNLPKIDVIIISHDHYDHLDMPTLEKLIERDKPDILVGLGVGRHFCDKTRDKAKMTELDWWQHKNINSKTKIHFVPTQHFSGRGLFDRHSTLWGAYVIESGNKKIYFGGDSGYADHYKKTYDKFGPMDVSLIPIGAYEPRDFMKYMHVNPEESVKAHMDLKSKNSIGMHYGTFQLTAEQIDDPPKKLEEAKKKYNIKADAFIAPEFGKTIVY